MMTTTTKCMAAALLACLTVTASLGQTLFTYGKQPVSRQEFLTAFNKNPDTTVPRAQALRDYLQLYIHYKLKVQAAIDAGLHNQPDLQQQTEQFKRQLAYASINQEADVKQLTREAWLRGREDLLVEQWYLPFTAADSGTKAAEAASLRQQLVTSRGQSKAASPLGWITVFSLPYEVENMVYQTPVGQISPVYKGKEAFHIFRTLRRRPAMGAVQIEQLLFAIPAGFTAEETQALEAKMRSAHTALQQGQTMAEAGLPAYISPATLTVKVGDYDPAFEDRVMNAKAGTLLPPIKTDFGWHLVRVGQRTPPPGDSTDAAAMAQLQQTVEQDKRLAEALKLLNKQWLRASGYKPAKYNWPEVVRYVDSFRQGGSTKAFTKVTGQTILFSFAQQNATVADFARYVTAVRDAGMDLKDAPLEQQFEAYQEVAVSEYYRNHVTELKPALAAQVKEFSDANLLFTIMEREVWNRASTDSAGLQAFYQARQASYQWQPSASILTLNGRQGDGVAALATKLQANPNDWRRLTQDSPLYTDSSRVEMDQLVGLPKPLKVGSHSGVQMQAVAGDTSYSYTQVLALHPGVQPRSFADARGLVISQYQQMLEEKWLADLRRKYPVVVNEAEVKKLK